MANDFITWTTQIDIQEIEKKLQLTNLKMPSIVSQMQRAVNRKVIAQARKNYTSQHDTDNHNYNYPNFSILKSFKTKSYKTDKMKSYVANNTFYSGFLEYGATIDPRRRNYLVIKENGEFKKAKSVRIEAKPFLKPAVDEFWNSDK